MLSSLKSNSIELWEDFGSNNDQNYLTHSIFRYFGKLPPLLTSKILTEFVPPKKSGKPLIIDLMCGSGTTLVEAQKMKIKSIGVDSNEISVLISKVKTTFIDIREINKVIDDFNQYFDSYYLNLTLDKKYIEKIISTFPNYEQHIPDFYNREKWFTKKNQVDLAVCRSWIQSWENKPDIFDFLLVCWLGIIRQCSNASVRAGRIFFDQQKVPPNVYLCLQKKIIGNAKIFEGISKNHFEIKPDIYLGDARSISFDLQDKADFSFFHPPYFALYKYSSDVLRFELEWGKFNRKNILKREIRDGFKTSNPDMIHPYICDIKLAIINAFNFTKKTGYVAIVIGNSTLSEKELPIVELLIKECKREGITCTKIIERIIKHSQATYHKSANPNIKTNSDYLLIFSKN